MHPTEAILMHVPAWCLVLARLTGLFLLSPMLGSQTVPRYAKAMLAFVLALGLYPALLSDPTGGAFTHIAQVIAQPPHLWSLIPMIGLELLIGYAIGYVAALPLIGLQVGGHMIDQQLGLAFAQIVNPELGEQSGLAAEFLFMTGLAIFALLGGHLVMFTILAGSFDKVPFGGMTGMAGLLTMIVGLLSIMFEMGMMVSAPVLCLMFLQSVGMGFLARTVPQMNILSIGFSIRILAGGGLFALTIAGCMDLYRGATMHMLRQLELWLMH